MYISLSFSLISVRRKQTTQEDDNTSDADNDPNKEAYAEIKTSNNNDATAPESHTGTGASSTTDTEEDADIIELTSTASVKKQIPMKFPRVRSHVQYIPPEDEWLPDLPKDGQTDFKVEVPNFPYDATDHMLVDKNPFQEYREVLSDSGLGSDSSLRDTSSSGVSSQADDSGIAGPSTSTPLKTPQEIKHATVSGNAEM